MKLLFLWTPSGEKVHGTNRLSSQTQLKSKRPLTVTTGMRDETFKDVTSPSICTHLCCSVDSKMSLAFHTHLCCSSRDPVSVLRSLVSCTLLVAIIPVYYVTFAKQPDLTANILVEETRTEQAVHHTNFSRVATNGLQTIKTTMALLSQNYIPSQQVQV